MSVTAFLRDRAASLLGLGLGLVFTAFLLFSLGLGPSAVGFLCAVFALCVLVPLGLDYVRRRFFYRRVIEVLDALEEAYLLPGLLREPGFPEGDLLCQVLSRTAHSMNDQVSAARRESREYREYVETWVHQVKTPIASARLLLENHPGPLAERLNEELFRIDGCVEQALFYARSGSVDRDYLVKAMALEDCVRSALRRYSRPLIAAGFRLDPGTWSAVVYTDSKWVEFILGQLISNAVKYHGPSPTLSFSCREERDAVLLTVADNGPGIPPEDLPRIFDKGFTGANGRLLSTRSTGLGLYLCRKLSRRLGLSIQAQSEPGQGTRIILTFPKGRLHLLED